LRAFISIFKSSFKEDLVNLSLTTSYVLLVGERWRLKGGGDRNIARKRKSCLHAGLNIRTTIRRQRGVIWTTGISASRMVQM
jgi:hypothetical protein